MQVITNPVPLLYRCATVKMHCAEVQCMYVVQSTVNVKFTLLEMTRSLNSLCDSFV